MNVLNISHVLKEIEIGQLEDEFQSKILNVINPLFPEDINIGTNTSGTELIDFVNNAVPRDMRLPILSAVVFSGDDVRRFYNEIERIQRDVAKEVQVDHRLKDSFVSHSAALAILVVIAMMAIYNISEGSRGVVPASKSLSVIEVVVRSIAGGQKLVTPPAPPEPVPKIQQEPTVDEYIE